MRKPKELLKTIRLKHEETKRIIKNNQTETRGNQKNY